MARRGYFENQNGNFRLRIVEPGYDADDEATPASKVIIDSNSLGVLSVLKSGLYVANNANQLNSRWIASGWNLPYIPLCTFLFNAGSSTVWAPYVSVGDSNDKLNVTSDGIFIDLLDIFDRAFPFRVRWTAYRLPVTP